MTQAIYALREFEGRGFKKFEDIPEEMFDYLPENMEDDNDDSI